MKVRETLSTILESFSTFLTYKITFDGHIYSEIYSILYMELKKTLEQSLPYML